MRDILYGLFRLIVLMPTLGYTNNLATEIESLIKQKMPHAIVSVVAKEATSNRYLYRRNATKLLMPASSTKLFTAVAVLDYLGFDYQLSTRLLRQGMDYYLQFAGDPGLTDFQLKSLLLSLPKSFGHIFIDMTRFQEPNYAGSVSYEDLGWYYAAPVTAAIIGNNALSYEFIPNKKLGRRITIKPQSPKEAIPIVNQVMTVTKEQAREHCQLNIDVLPNNKLRLYGCLAQAKKAKTMRLAITDPLNWVKHRVKEVLKEKGTLYKQAITQRKTPHEATQIAEIKSQPIRNLVQKMLKESDNLYANSLVKQLGYLVTKDGSNKQGVFAIKKILAQRQHLDKEQLMLADGEGTRYTLISALQLVNLLSDIYQNESYRSYFFKALPIAGVDGTLTDRMKTPPLAGKVIAKTGTMHDVSSLSGYLLTSSSRVIIFSILINGINRPIKEAKQLEEQILLKLMAAYEQQFTPPD